MSSIYKHWSWDDNDNSIDITGENLRTLIDICFRYSSMLYLFSWEKKNELPNELKNNWITSPDYIKKELCYAPLPGKITDHLFAFRCIDETKLFLQSAMTGLFESIDGFEDLTFYREDGRIFLRVITHEGECYFYPDDNEDVEKIVTKDHWICLGPVVNHRNIPIFEKVFNQLQRINASGFINVHVCNLLDKTISLVDEQITAIKNGEESIWPDDVLSLVIKPEMELMRDTAYRPYTSLERMIRQRFGDNPDKTLLSYATISAMDNSLTESDIGQKICEIQLVIDNFL